MGHGARQGAHAMHGSIQARAVHVRPAGPAMHATSMHAGMLMAVCFGCCCAHVHSEGLRGRCLSSALAALQFGQLHSSDGYGVRWLPRPGFASPCDGKLRQQQARRCSRMEWLAGGITMLAGRMSASSPRHCLLPSCSCTTSAVGFACCSSHHAAAVWSCGRVIRL